MGAILAPCTAPRSSAPATTAAVPAPWRGVDLDLHGLERRHPDLQNKIVRPLWTDARVRGTNRLPVLARALRCHLPQDRVPSGHHLAADVPSAQRLLRAVIVQGRPHHDQRSDKCPPRLGADAAGKFEFPSKPQFHHSTILLLAARSPNRHFTVQRSFALPISGLRGRTCALSASRSGRSAQREEVRLARLDSTATIGGKLCDVWVSLEPV